MKNRFILDQKSGVYLLFPDQVVLQLIAETKEDGRSYVSIGISLSALIDDPLTPTPNRPIVLINQLLDAIRPIDHRIFKFRFVKKEALTGAITLACESSDWPEIKRRLAEDPSYLRITYKGTTEEYWASQRLASIELNQNETHRLGLTNNIYKQLSMLRYWMGERSSMSDEDIDAWLQFAVDSKFPVQSLNGSFLLQAPNSAVNVEYRKTIQSVSTISEDPEKIRIRWED